MSDYGHPLLFGSFITPANADPARTVGLAVLAEEIGLDLVTFQDHPYQPAFLDTWTLLSYAIEAMGGRRLTGGQALRALEEAIDRSAALPPFRPCHMSGNEHVHH